MELEELYAYYDEKWRSTMIPYYRYLGHLITQSIYVDFHSKEHLSNWLDEVIEDWFDAYMIEIIGRQDFDDEICKIANTIADKRQLQ